LIKDVVRRTLLSFGFDGAGKSYVRRAFSLISDAPAHRAAALIVDHGEYRHDARNGRRTSRVS